jgi:Dolichyl-phosphate-mannose-protein mannosyltransferase
LAGAAVVWLTGLFARELGGGRFAQFMGATAILVAPAYLAFDSFLSMNAFEPLLWLLCIWIVVRIVKGGDPRLWLVFGAVSGIALENKHSMFVCGFALAAGLFLSGESRLYRSRWIWIALGIALAISLPNLLWEAHHGWPQVEVVLNGQRFKNLPISPSRFMVEQILFLHPLSLPFWAGGLAWLFFSKEGKRFRFLGWTYVIVIAIFILLHGKTYYALPIYPILMAAGGVAWERAAESWRRARWALQFAFPSILILGGLAAVPFGIPILPVDSFLRYSQAIPSSAMVKAERDAPVPLPQLYADMFGWENMASTIASVYNGLPASERADCAILAGNYGEAGAIDYFGPALGLPKAIGGHNSYFDWGPRNYSGNCVILFGERANQNKELFGEVQRVATITNPHAMEIEQNVPVYLCRKPVAPLAVLWPRFKMII